MAWTDAGSVEDLRKSGSRLHREGTRQIAIFAREEGLYALDNRCPHEGYPLIQGTTKQCVLTCNWHNWKFDLKTGANLAGGDNVRVYPVRERDGRIEVDIAEPDPGATRAKSMEDLRRAFDERDTNRIYRELARLHFHGHDMNAAVKAALLWHHDRLEYGMEHPVPAAADWLRLADEAGDDLETRICFLGEAVDYFSFETLRHQVYPYTDRIEAWDEAAFQAAVETEDEDAAIARLRGALRETLPREDILAALAKASFAHYSDFGHSAIYVYKCADLIQRFGAEVAPALYLCLTRSLIHAWREDKIPEFKGYTPTLAAFPASFGTNDVTPNIAPLLGASVNQCLAWTVDAATVHTRRAVYEALLRASALTLLGFDTERAVRVDAKPGDTASWLGLTHMITFANAVRNLSETTPALWPAGLLQMACFLGRNAKHSKPALGETKWAVDNVETFFARSISQVADHGNPEPIRAAHLLKTMCAVREEIACCEPQTKIDLLAALNRYLNTPLKDKHVRRSVRQGITLVSRDFTGEA